MSNLNEASFESAEIADTTQSTSTSTGALTVAGGVGIGKNLNVGGQLKLGDYTFPTSTGSEGQLLEVNGSGNLVFTNKRELATNNSFEYLYDVDTDGTVAPDATSIKFDSTTMADATTLYMTNSDSNSNDISPLLDSWISNPAGNTTVGHVKVSKKSDPDSWVYYDMKSSSDGFPPNAFNCPLLGVSFSDSIHSSSNGGKTWSTIQAAGSVLGTQLRDIAYNGSRWIVVGAGTNGSIAYSDDNGASWTAVSGSGTVFSALGRGVAFSPQQSRWIVVGNDAGTNKAAYSTDNGVTFTACTYAGAMYQGIDVAWNGKDRWVMGGETAPCLAHSTDGITFTDTVSSVFSLFCYSVSYLPKTGRWVAGGEGTNVLAYSDDGVTWTGSANGNGIFDTSVTSVANDGESRWIAMGTTGTSKIAYSDDGVNWIPVNNVSFNASYVTYDTASRRFVYLGSTTSAYSEDGGLTWTLGGTLTAGMSNIASCDLLPIQCPLVAVGSGTYQIAYSLDSGDNWTGVSGSFWTSLGDRVHYNGRNRWVAVGDSANVYWSADGINWNESTYSGGTMGTGAAISYSAPMNRWVLSCSSTNGIWYSDDNGETFIYTAANYVKAIAYNGTDKFIGGGSSGLALYSNDGIDWTTLSNADLLGTINDIAYGENGVWVATGGSAGNDTIMYSLDDGVTWAVAPDSDTVISGAGYGVDYSPVLKQWVVVSFGTGNDAAYSYDGINWTNISFAGISLRDVKWSTVDSKWIIGGYSGIFYLSTDGISWSAASSAAFTTSAQGVASCDRKPAYSTGLAGKSHGTHRQLYLEYNTQSSSAPTFTDTETLEVSFDLSGYKDATFGTTQMNRVSVNDNLTAKGLTNMTNTTQSTTTSNGALIVAGGVGVAKNLNVGGSMSLTDATIITADNNIVVAASSSITSGTNNLCLGGGNSITTSSDNIAIGSLALDSLASSGGQNVAIGVGAMTDSSCAADDSIAIGYYASENQAGGDFCTVVGSLAGGSIYNQSYCTAVGYSAFITGGSTGGYNSCFGANSTVTGTATNSCAIGYQASTSESNTIMLGNFNVTAVVPNSAAECWLGTDSNGFAGVHLNAYTTSQAEALAQETEAGNLIYVSDGDAGSPCLAVSNGTNYLRISLGSAISAT